MAENEDRRRILDMLAAGTISVDEAANLLKALGPGTPGRAIEPPAPPRPAGQARLLRISIDAVKPEDEGGENAKVRINVPIALARFATRFLPKEASAELQEQGVNIEEILNALGEELPDGKLVDIDAQSEDPTQGSSRIVIEVV